MSFSKDGSGLTILIHCDNTLHDEWLVFAAWYSFAKFFPKSDVIVVCPRNAEKLNFCSYDWTYRTATRVIQHNNKGNLNKLYGTYLCLKENIVKCPILVIDQYVMAIRNLSNDFSGIDYGYNNSSLYFNNGFIEIFEETIDKLEEKSLDLLKFTKEKILWNNLDKLISSCKEKDRTAMVSYNKGCGKFNFADWKSKYRVAPFRYVHYLRSMDMTANESKILDLWHRMASFYETIR